MFDLRWIREHAEAFDDGLRKRGLDPMSADILALDEKRRAHVTAVQDIQTRRNAASKEIGKAKSGGDEARANALIAEVAQLKAELQAGEVTERALTEELNDVLSEVPNTPLADVPVGQDESANECLREVGTPPQFGFEPKQHFDIGEGLGLMDFESAAKISGARFVVLKGALARLERALASFMLDLHTAEFGYTEVQPPLLVRDPAMFGTGQLPKFEDDLFATNAPIDDDEFYDFYRGLFDDERYVEQVGDTVLRPDGITETRGQLNRDGLIAVHQYLSLKNRLWLIPTAEVSLTNLVRDSILDEAQLPLRFTAGTACFRAEAGAAGKDTRGMIRQHQFSKVELVSIARPEDALQEHERMTACAEEVLKRLGLAYRVMVLSTGDMGFGAQRTYDLEVWLPGQDTYREISSCSVCGDFQARRMNARYRPEGSKELRFVHTLNGSGLAVGRTLVALLENYQQADGGVLVPEALQPYMGGFKRIAPDGALKREGTG